MGCCWNSSGSIRIISLVIPGSRSKGQRQSRSRILMCTAKGQPPLGRRHQQQRPAMGGMASKVKHLVFGKFSSQSLPGGGGGGSGECHRCCRCCCRRSSFAMRCHALLFVSLFKRQVDASAALAASLASALFLLLFLLNFLLPPPPLHGLFHHRHCFQRLQMQPIQQAPPSPIRPIRAHIYARTSC